MLLIAATVGRVSRGLVPRLVNVAPPAASPLLSLLLHLLHFSQLDLSICQFSRLQSKSTQ